MFFHYVDPDTLCAFCQSTENLFSVQHFIGQTIWFIGHLNVSSKQLIIPNFASNIPSTQINKFPVSVYLKAAIIHLCWSFVVHLIGISSANFASRRQYQFIHIANTKLATILHTTFQHTRWSSKSNCSCSKSTTAAGNFMKIISKIFI